jgi:hypothetical protein
LLPTALICNSISNSTAGLPHPLVFTPLLPDSDSSPAFEIRAKSRCRGFSSSLPCCRDRGCFRSCSDVPCATQSSSSRKSWDHILFCFACVQDFGSPARVSIIGVSNLQCYSRSLPAHNVTAEICSTLLLPPPWFASRLSCLVLYTPRAGRMPRAGGWGAPPPPPPPQYIYAPKGLCIAQRGNIPRSVVVAARCLLRSPARASAAHAQERRRPPPSRFRSACGLPLHRQHGSSSRRMRRLAERRSTGSRRPSLWAMTEGGDSHTTGKQGSECGEGGGRISR